MNLGDVKARVAHISAVSSDDEIAHGEEDDLYEDVLIAIADGKAEQPAAMAREALKTQDMDFRRWCG